MSRDPRKLPPEGLLITPTAEQKGGKEGWTEEKLVQAAKEGWKEIVKMVPDGDTINRDRIMPNARSYAVLADNAAKIAAALIVTGRDMSEASYQGVAVAVQIDDEVRRFISAEEQRWIQAQRIAANAERQQHERAVSDELERLERRYYSQQQTGSSTPETPGEQKPAQES